MNPLAIILLALASAFLLPSFSAADETQPPLFGSQAKPFLAKYCHECHGMEKQKAKVNLEQYPADARIIESRKFWEKVHEMILNRDMPPEEELQPTEEEREAMVQFLEMELAKFDCSGPVNPGRVTLRRLNRNEYRNTVRDLMGVDLDPTEEFPTDEVGYGFDNIGDVLSLPPMLMEKYLAAAERVATAAVDLDYPPQPPTIHVAGNRLKPSQEDDVRPEGDRGLGLYREGNGSAEITIAKEGRYRLRVRAFGEQAGLEPPRLGVQMDESKLKEFNVEAVSAKPDVYEVETDLSPGSHRLHVAYLNNYVSQDHPDPKLRGDRNLFVNWVEVVGPVNAEVPPPSAAHARLFVCDPRHSHTRECARTILDTFASRAFRRPVTDREVGRLLRLHDMVRQDDGSFNEAIQVAVQAVLVSPYFLFRWELDPEPAAPEGVRPLRDFELASRLSYFLWSSMPDEQLLRLAGEGRLRDVEVLKSEALRMLQDPRAEALVRHFGGQWLQIRNLDSMTPDPDLFPTFDETLRRSMRRETEMFFAAVMREDRSILDFLDADFTFLNGPLARHYGIQGVEGEAFQRVKLDKSSRRGGVLTHASVLTITSNPTRTSPVIRGKWILEQILGTPPPPPPPNVPELENNESAIASASLRQRMEMHRAKPECATCHNKMDAMGFAFENFNAVGQWRDRDGTFPIDPSGTLPTGESFQGPEELKRILRSRESFLLSLSEKMLTYALGRGLEYYDKCAVDDVVANLKAHDHRFSALVQGIVESRPFRFKSVGSTTMSAALDPEGN